MDQYEICKPQGIIIFGLNGSGKTTLGREVAKILDFKHMDIEDYHFHESEIPYSNPRTQDECLELMLADIKKHHSFVITIVNGDYLGEEILSMCIFAVYLVAPIEARIKRIEQRGYDKFGGRVCVGGDMHEQELKFRKFVAARSSERIEQWSNAFKQPIVSVDGMEDYKNNAINIARLYNEFLGKRLVE